MINEIHAHGLPKDVLERLPKSAAPDTKANNEAEGRSRPPEPVHNVKDNTPATVAKESTGSSMWTVIYTSILLGAVACVVYIFIKRKRAPELEQVYARVNTGFEDDDEYRI